MKHLTIKLVILDAVTSWKMQLNSNLIFIDKKQNVEYLMPTVLLNVNSVLIKLVPYIHFNIHFQNKDTGFLQI